MPEQNTPDLNPEIPKPAAPQPQPSSVPAPAPMSPPLAPAPAAAPVNQTGAGHVDFDKLVLPRKNVPSVDSAQRINAGALFEQEQNASLPAPQKKEAPAPAPKKEEAFSVRPLQTYQGDIESLVDKKNVSVVTIAAAEADRRGMAKLGDSLAEKPSRPWLGKMLMILGGALCVLFALGITYYLYMRLQPVPIAEQSPAPFISVDATLTVPVSAEESRSAAMQKLVASRDAVDLSLGLIARLQIVAPSADGISVQEIAAQDFLPLLARTIPPALLRTLEPQMLLGIHSYDENQTFMILKADSYETAYAGLLAWETSMRADLLPLFNRTPAVRARPAVPTGPVASTTGTTTAAAATSTASTTSAASEATPQFFVGNFSDKIVENRDTRVVLNSEGDILLLWTFLDRSTIVITTNDATLREVISRLSQASILSLPQQ